MDRNLQQAPRSRTGGHRLDEGSRKQMNQIAIP